jgi:hypothetical protein
MKRYPSSRSLLPLALVLLAACGPAGGNGAGRLTVRPGYTEDTVIAAFETRYLREADSSKPGQVSIEGKQTRYASVTDAIVAAPDGATIQVGPGIYRESVVVSGRRVSIVGAGAGLSLVVAQETALYASRSDITVSGIGFWSLTVGPDVAVAALSESRAILDDCRFTGGTGAGVVSAGTGSVVSLTGNLVSGNMGGGLRLQGGRLDLRRNIIVRNAQAGIVLAPSSPGAIGRFSSWHDTVLDNWTGHRCVSLAKAGIVPIAPLDRFTFDASILNSGGLGEAFSEEFYGTVKANGRNFLSVSALPAPDFFIDADGEDYRPRGRLVTDALGLELGANPSSEGLTQLKTVLSNALMTEKLQLAYILSLFLPAQARAEAHDRIRAVLDVWVGEFLQTGRLGTRLFAVLGLAREVPAHWRMEVVLERFLAGFDARYTFRLQPLNFFPEDEALGQRILSYLEGRMSLFPRHIVRSGDGENAFVLSGHVLKPIARSSAGKPFALKRVVENPYFGQLGDTARQLESRLVEKQKKIDDIRFTLDNPHFGAVKQQNSRYRQGLEKKLEGLEEDKARLVEQVASIRKAIEDSAERFDVELKGTLRETTSSGEFSQTLVAAPGGEILLDLTQVLSFVDIDVSVTPLPRHGFAGKELSVRSGEPLDLAATALAQAMQEAVIAKETRTLKTLLDRYHSGLIETTAEDQLVELLLLNAHLYQKALELRPEYEKLQAEAAGTQGGIQAGVVFDSAAGPDSRALRVDVSYSDARAQRERIKELEGIYKPYWELQPQVDQFLKLRFGLTDKELFDTRAVLDRLLPQDTK